MYIKFEKHTMIHDLPEKRPNMIFNNPDVFIIFGTPKRFVIWGEVLENLSPEWFGGIDMWETHFDFGIEPDDYDKQFDDYFTVELSIFPVIENSKVSEFKGKNAFIFDSNKELYINTHFIEELKSVGAVDVWYDTTAPYGRY
jgi:hypothetical protein